MSSVGNCSSLPGIPPSEGQAASQAVPPAKGILPDFTALETESLLSNEESQLLRNFTNALKPIQAGEGKTPLQLLSEHLRGTEAVFEAILKYNSPPESILSARLSAPLRDKVINLLTLHIIHCLKEEVVRNCPCPPEVLDNLFNNLIAEYTLSDLFALADFHPFKAASFIERRITQRTATSLMEKKVVNVAARALEQLPANLTSQPVFSAPKSLTLKNISYFTATTTDLIGTLHAMGQSSNATVAMQAMAANTLVMSTVTAASGLNVVASILSLGYAARKMIERGGHVQDSFLRLAIAVAACGEDPFGELDGINLGLTPKIEDYTLKSSGKAGIKKIILGEQKAGQVSAFEAQQEIHDLRAESHAEAFVKGQEKIALRTLQTARNLLEEQEKKRALSPADASLKTRLDFILKNKNATIELQDNEMLLQEAVNLLKKDLYSEGSLSFINNLPEGRKKETSNLLKRMASIQARVSHQERTEAMRKAAAHGAGIVFGAAGSVVGGASGAITGTVASIAAEHAASRANRTQYNLEAKDYRKKAMQECLKELLTIVLTQHANTKDPQNFRDGLQMIQESAHLFRVSRSETSRLLLEELRSPTGSPQQTKPGEFDADLASLLMLIELEEAGFSSATNAASTNVAGDDPDINWEGIIDNDIVLDGLADEDIDLSVLSTQPAETPRSVSTEPADLDLIDSGFVTPQPEPDENVKNRPNPLSDKEKEGL